MPKSNVFRTIRNVVIDPIFFVTGSQQPRTCATLCADKWWQRYFHTYVCCNLSVRRLFDAEYRVTIIIVTRRITGSRLDRGYSTASVAWPGLCKERRKGGARQGRCKGSATGALAQGFGQMCEAHFRETNHHRTNIIIWKK